MRQSDSLHLVWTNRNIRELPGDARAPKLHVIEHGGAYVERKAEQLKASPDGFALGTLQALLNAEVQFLNLLQDAARKNALPHEEANVLIPRINHENIFHIARFLFLLRELNCESPSSLGRFIDSHNDRIQNLFEMEDYSFRTASELKKAYFSKQRKFVMLETVRERGHVAFARTEIADFLFDHMSRDRANAAVDLLCAAGLLAEIERDSFDSSNRKPVYSPSGVIENAYGTYLDEIRRSVIAVK